MFEGRGRVNEYVGGYRDWLRHKPATPDTPPPSRDKPRRSPSNSAGTQKELRALPGKIEKLEAKIEALQQKLAAPDYYQQEADVIRADQQQLKTLEAELQALYRRWEELESG